MDDERKRTGMSVAGTRLARMLTLFGQACVLATLVAAVSCATELGGTGDDDSIAAKIEPYAEILIDVLIPIFFGGSLIWWTRLLARKTDTSYRSAGDSGREFVMMFGVLITGIFIFMTFRIDRGAQSEARRTAEEVAERVAERVVERVAGEAADQVAEESEKAIANLGSAIFGTLIQGGEESDRLDHLGSLDSLERTDIGLFLQVQPPQDATDLEVGSEPERHVVGEGDPPVWFRFDVTTAGMYRVAVRDFYGDLSFDPVIYLYSIEDGSLSFVSYDDDSGGGLDSRLDAELIPGAHYVAVREFNGSGGDFSIEVVLLFRTTG